MFDQLVCLELLCAPLIRSSISFLLLDLLFHSSCSIGCFFHSTCCSTFFARLDVLLLLLNLLFHFSCSTCCSTPLVRLVVPLLLFDLFLYSSCSTCFGPFARPVVSFLLLNLFYIFCSTFLLKYLSITVIFNVGKPAP
jgi:hypothetical protein